MAGTVRPMGIWRPRSRKNLPPVGVSRKARTTSVGRSNCNARAFVVRPARCGAITRCGSRRVRIAWPSFPASPGGEGGGTPRRHGLWQRHPHLRRLLLVTSARVPGPSGRRDQQQNPRWRGIAVFSFSYAAPPGYRWPVQNKPASSLPDVCGSNLYQLTTTRHPPASSHQSKSGRWRVGIRPLPRA